MPKEKSVGAVVFIEQDDDLLFLLLHYTAGHWGFPKGHVEPGETEEQTLLREVEEETGLKGVEIIPGFEQHTSYFFRGNAGTVFKEVVFYLARAPSSDVRLSSEHQAFRWLPFQNAMKRLTFKNTRAILQRANSFLRQKNGADS
ncbi:MAG: NUDIX domain-containing protein [Candidatus Diapherotrites archaeon]|uniref:Bis(5'-nucleosyl)-tetraphosphatase [asymmetrical] n=1 Tax=Candidatus Iainarchaeum sp. TaxID=3101447 RepID=A0A938YNF7_9ARCH|nr:NUDIX domain-containing protein [Candidatus Diapherotrites archaeon]